VALSEFLPTAALAELVRVYRIAQFEFDRGIDIPCKPYPPRPEQCLSFYPRDTEFVLYPGSRKTFGGLKAVVFGQHDVVSNRFVGHDFLLLQVVFRPGALYRLTGIPAALLNNAYLDAELIFSSPIKTVNEQLANAKSHSQMIRIIEDFLLGMTKRNYKAAQGIDKLGNMILENRDGVTIDWMAKTCFLSPRQFERKFIERTGVGPKYFSKIIRFEHAFRLRNKRPDLDWLGVAIQAGYYDYQHLARDYKAFTQYTPVAFHVLDGSSPERSFGEADTY
jgi:AraC-like DNA-binding protein